MWCVCCDAVQKTGAPHPAVCNCLFVQVNHSPSFNIDSPLDKSIKGQLIIDAVRLVRHTAGWPTDEWVQPFSGMGQLGLYGCGRHVDGPRMIFAGLCRASN